MSIIKFDVLFYLFFEVFVDFDGGGIVQIVGVLDGGEFIVNDYYMDGDDKFCSVSLYEMFCVMVMS